MVVLQERLDRELAAAGSENQRMEQELGRLRSQQETLTQRVCSSHKDGVLVCCKASHGPQIARCYLHNNLQLPGIPWSVNVLLEVALIFTAAPQSVV